MAEDMKTLKRFSPKCEYGDIYYNGYCFWFDVTGHNFAASESICRSRDSSVGIILGSSHYNKMMNNLRGNTVQQFWLGLRQDPSTGAVTVISNGLKAPFLKWFSGQPDRGSSEPNIRLRVDTVASSALNGMGDIAPSYSFGVICQYKSL